MVDSYFLAVMSATWTKTSFFAIFAPNSHEAKCGTRCAYSSWVPTTVYHNGLFGSILNYTVLNNFYHGHSLSFLMVTIIYRPRSSRTTMKTVPFLFPVLCISIKHAIVLCTFSSQQVRPILFPFICPSMLLQNIQLHHNPSSPCNCCS